MSSPASAIIASGYRLQRSLSLSELSSLRPPQRTSLLPLDVSTAQIKPLGIITLASFERCSCDRFDGGQTHLSIRMRIAKLDGTKGVAISYAWGEFDRQKRCIGHKRDSPADDVDMVLGSEWKVSSVQERLAQLTEQHDGCWVDQICMLGPVQKRRKTLKAIPAIFRTLHVTVLLPGSLCGCLRKAFDEYQSAKLEVDEQKASANQPSDEISARLDRHMKRSEICLTGTDCLNSNGTSSWTKRLWTLQEFVYSRSCSFLFANQEVMECCEFEDSLSGVKPEQLNDNSRRFYEDHVGRSLPREESVVFLRLENLANWMSQHLMVLSKAPGPVNLRHASLLLGDLQVWDVTSHRHYRVVPFLTSLIAIAKEPRTATKPADYILSVFPAVDGYIVPRNFKHLSPIELLEDALAQLCKLQNLYIPNLSPMGLSGSICSSAQWSPDISRAATEIRDSKDIYGSFLWEMAIQNAHDLDTWVEGLDITEAIAHFLVMILQWEHGSPHFSHLQRRFGGSFKEATAKLKSSSESERVVGLMLSMSFLLDRAMSEEDILKEKSFLGFLNSLISMRVLEKAIHGLICEFLHLDATRCQQNGIRPIFSQYTGSSQAGTQEGGMSCQTCIGLVNGGSFDQARSSGAELLTIGHHGSAESPVYEAVRVPGTSSLEYRVIGVWVPLYLRFKVAEVGAIMVDESEEHNAYVV
ncbi:hypothetical protein LTR67_005247 [Exophiala xenobiotica]